LKVISASCIQDSVHSVIMRVFVWHRCQVAENRLCHIIGSWKSL